MTRRIALPAMASAHARPDARDMAARDGVRDLAREAWRQAHGAPHDDTHRRIWLERAHRLAPADGTVALGLAAVLLRSGSADEAARLFRAVADEHDSAEAWLGFAACAHRLGRAEAADALHVALSRGAMSPAARALAAALAGPAGWCALDGDGVLHAGPRPPERVALDGRRVDVSWRDGRARLPPGWRRARCVEADTAGVALLGSPVDVRAITAMQGVVALRDGHVEGWAWYPADPGRDPVLLLRRGRARLRVVARDPAPDADLARPLARPRRFRVALAALDGAGPVRVLDANGRDLPGSPLHPGADTRVPVPRRRRGRPADAADVVIPVHGGTAHSLACLRAVLSTVPPGTRVHVVDDASPEPELVRALDGLAAMGRIRLIRFRRNRGFPAAANAGLRACAGRDAVLLNSDTLVPPGWLERLRAAAHAAADIGSATPLSNGDGLVGYPGVSRPDEDAARALDLLAQRANAGLHVDLPTAVGFCMYIRRECLDATGLFREDLFAQGYGEENDWCLRARRLGWRHVAAADTYVAHRGAASFGAARPALLRRNLAVLHRLYPGYEAEVAAHAAADPLAPARRRMDVLRWAEGRRAAGCVVLVTHAGGGGVDEAVAARCAALRAQGLRAVVLRPRDGRCAVQDGAGEGEGEREKEGYPGLVYRLPAEAPELAALLAPDRPRRMEVHHLLGHDRAVLDLCRAWDVPYDLYVHDYAWLCARIALVGPGGRYCGEPDPPGCARCEASLGSHLDLPVPALLARSAAEFAGARRVIAPSADGATRVRRRVSGVRAEVRPWEDDAALPPLHPAPGGPVRRVCVVGAIGVEKGFDVLLACARDAAARGLALEFVVVGHTANDAALMAAGPAFVTGPYRPQEAVALVRRQGAHLAFIPSVWPETWCFALTRAWQAGLAAAVFDLGAQAERVRRTGRGWVLPPGLGAGAVNDALLRLTPPAPRTMAHAGVGRPRLTGA